MGRNPTLVLPFSHHELTGKKGVTLFLHNKIADRRKLVHLLSLVGLVDILFYTQMLDSLDVAL